MAWNARKAERKVFGKKTRGHPKQPLIRTIIIVMAECGAAW